MTTEESAGLTAAQARAALEQYGRDELESAEPIRPLGILLSQFKDLMVLILLAAAGVALASWYLGGRQGLPADAIVIGAIVVLNAGLGFAQEYRAEKTLQALKRITSGKAQVIRDGQRISIERDELVPGDLVELDEGDKVPADLKVLSASRLEVDESLLTGESVVVPKTAEDELFAGTVVTGGSGRGRVTATGARTQLGGIATTLSSSVAAVTPLERRLARLGAQIGWGVLILTVVITITFVAIEQRFDVPSLIRVLMFAVALAVAAVPEGLPAVLTVSLSAGTRRLVRRHTVVRKMSAVETLGSVTVIVTDKTGTLTHNQMTVTHLYAEGAEIAVTGLGYGADGGLSSPAPELFLAAAVLANRADLEEKEGRRHALGDPTEASLLVLADKAGLDWRSLRSRSPQLDEIPFSSERRRMRSIRDYNGERWIFCKGSLEALEPACLPDQRDWREHERHFAVQGLRTLALAARKLEGDGAPESALVMLGLVAMKDPPRQEVPDALARCREAGIRVLMLTGDHPETAAAIGREIGLIAVGDEALLGPALEAMTPENRAAALSSHSVFARLSPKGKLQLVDDLMARGEVVAMTGDGVNDAAALKKVHVGVAMGSGTAVAIEASDLVLLDDNFASLVTAIGIGRGVYSNVQRFIAFLFSGNFGVVLAMFLGLVCAGLMGMREHEQLVVPLIAAQILWMNLVADGAPAVAFALGRSPEDVMRVPPRDPDEPILSPSLWGYLLFTGSWVAVMLLLVLDFFYPGGFITGEEHTLEYARTAGFYAVVTSRLWNALNFRHLPGSVLSRDLFRDFYVPGACLVSWLMTLALLVFPSLGQLFGLVPVEASTLIWLTALAPVILMPAEVLKLIVPIQLTSARVSQPRIP